MTDIDTAAQQAEDLARAEEVLGESLNQDTPLPDSMLALELAWGIIANVSEGDWSKQSPEWVEAAERWRDDHWFKALAERHA